MKQLIAVVTCVFLLIACQKSNSDGPADQLNGRYKGSFTRTGMDTSQVTINFRNGNLFDGSGGPLHYPSICGGSFQQSGNSLMVNDTCSWTANFDWTLIFDGNYNITLTGENSVRIWRTNGAVTDEYLLNRITR